MLLYLYLVKEMIEQNVTEDIYFLNIKVILFVSKKAATVKNKKKLKIVKYFLSKINLLLILRNECLK